MEFVPYLRQLVAGFSPLWSWFNPASSHVGSVLDEVALGQIFSEYFGFSCHSFIPVIAPQSSPSIIQGLVQ
jgi:hypothetical protein